MRPLKTLNTIDKFNNKSLFNKFIIDLKKYIKKGGDLNAQKTTHPLISESVKYKLVELFAEDVAMVEQTLSRKITAWDN